MASQPILSRPSTHHNAATLRITDLAAADRPRERLAAMGAEALADAELLAIVLRTGRAGQSAIQLAQRLLAEHGGWSGLARLSVAELTRVPGVGSAKAAQVKAACEIARRLLRATPPRRQRVRSPADVAPQLVLEMGTLAQEHLRTVLLNTQGDVLAIETVAIGWIDHADVRAADVFRAALRHGAASLILVHNHPGGDLMPSADDLVVTDVLVEAGRLLGIAVRDHLIVTQGGYVSLRERGYRFGD